MAELRAVLIPVALAFRADFDPPTQRAYHRTLEAVPLPALHAAVERAQASGRQFFPTAPELRAWAEDARVAMRSALKYEPCAQCDETGWEHHVIDGVTRAKRCGCWARHQQKVQALGVGAEPLALPVARDWTGDAA